MLNYARSLIYTTSLSYANIIAADASFDMLIDGTASHVSLVPSSFPSNTQLAFSFQLAKHLLSLSAHLTSTLSSALTTAKIPPSLVRLHSSTSSSSSSPSSSSYNNQSPIIPILTPHPRPLSSYLLAHGMNARPITWPTVPKGKDRVRVCLHAGNTKEDVDKLVWSVVKWAKEVLSAGKGGVRQVMVVQQASQQQVQERSKL